jgi:hypothetical protein
MATLGCGRGIRHRVGIDHKAPRARTRVLPTVTLALAIGAAPLGVSAPPSAAARTPAFPTQTTFLGVSCTSPGNCTAVGYVGHEQTEPDSGPVLRPIVATERASIWGKLKVLTSYSPTQLTGVSCASPGNCAAVGYDFGSSYSNHGDDLVGYPVVASETAGSWGAVTAVTTLVGDPYSSSTIGEGFTSVSCSSVGNCTAVGGAISGDTDSEGQASYAEETNATWGPATFAGTTGLLMSVSCTSASDCTAVGGDYAYDGEYGLFDENYPIVVSESGGTWGAPIEMPIADEWALSGVSCTAAGDCTAVSGPNYVTASGGTWGAPHAVSMPGTDGGLASISCTTATSCTAVGERTSRSFGLANAESVRLIETSGTWGPVQVGGGGGLASIDCFTATTCTSVGSFDLCHADLTCVDPSTFPLYATEGAGSWPGAPTPPILGRVTPIDRALTVSWSTPLSSGGSAITGYTAVAITGLHGSPREYACSSTRTRCTITGLTRGRAYTVSVYAWNDAGSSPSSSIRTAKPLG